MSVVSLDPKIEQELVKAAKLNKSSFAKLYNHYFPHIKRFIENRVYNQDDGEDLTSSVFQKAFVGIDSFKWQGVSFSSWLYRIAHNTLVDYYRTQEKQKNKVSIIDDIHESKFNTPEQDAIEYNQSEFMQKLLLTLPDREKKIIYSKFFEGNTNKQIATKLNLSETNVSTIVYRVLKKLRENLIENPII